MDSHKKRFNIQNSDDVKIYNNCTFGNVIELEKLDELRRVFENKLKSRDNVIQNMQNDIQHLRQEIQTLHGILKNRHNNSKPKYINNNNNNRSRSRSRGNNTK